MKQGYNNPMVTYEEIVEALKAILECSLNNDYFEDFNYLNTKYNVETLTKLEGAEEKALRKAVRSLEKTIDSAHKIIKGNLERDLNNIKKDIIKINSSYIIGHELRKLAAQDVFVEKLMSASLSLDTLSHAPEQKKEDLNTNKVFSDFEKSALVNFPDFFKDEIKIANGEEVPLIDDDIIDMSDIFNTMEITPLTFNEDEDSKIEEIEDKPKEKIKKEEKDKKVEKPINFFDEPFVFGEPSKEPEEKKEEAKEEPKEIVEKSKPKITKEINKEKVLLIKKALVKAKEKNDEKLIKALKKQLAKELGVEK